jgi:hypothetical protein
VEALAVVAAERAAEPVAVVVAPVRVEVPEGGAVQAEETLAVDAAEWAEAISQVSRTLTIHITNPA